MKAVIMAAGKGTRMLPITETIPKVLIPVGEVPFLKYVIERVQKAGITDIGIVTSYKSDMVKAFLDEEGIKATIIDQGEPLGTGHAIKVAKEFIGNDHFIALGGDNLWSVQDIKAVMHDQHEWCVAAWTVKNPEKYGVLVCNNNKLKKIIEKPKEFVGNLINSGLYKFTPDVFNTLENIDLSPRGEYELTDALTLGAQEDKVHVCPLKDYWLDLGKLEDIPNVEEFLAQLEKNHS